MIQFFIKKRVFHLQTFLGLAGLICTFLCTSCSKNWLEEKSDKNQAIPTSLKDYQALLDMDRFIINDNVIGLGEVATDDHYITETSWINSTSTNATNAYTWSQEAPYENFSNWETFFSRVYILNLVLDGLNKIAPQTSADKDDLEHIKAQALFIRAESFWWLAQLYAQPYNEANANSDMGIPMQISSDMLQAVKRVTVRETYDQIINDLREAFSSLPVEAQYPTRASRLAAYAVMARTFMVMNKYDSALVYAGKYLQAQNTLIDYSTLSTTANFIGLYGPEVIYHDQLYTDGLASFLTSRCLINPSLFDLYEADDLRKSIFYKVTGSNITFKGNYNNSTSGLFCGVATDEIYLIRSECYARTGKIPEAMKDLNDLLRTRWKKNPDGTTTYVDQTASNEEEALELILTERRKELILRGLRWSDLRRLNQEERFKTTLSRTIGGKTYTLEPNSYKYTFPIPIDVITINGMKQTPGWEE